MGEACVMIKLDYVLTFQAPIQVLTDECDRLKSEENTTLISSIFFASFFYLWSWDRTLHSMY